MDRLAAAEQLAARRFDLLVDRRRDHRRRDRRGGDRARARRRAGRPRRLRLGHLIRVVEARPRRTALPADGRRPARPRGAPGAPLPDERRRPHLVHRLPFLFPLYEDGPHRPIVVRTGVLLYSALARARLNGRISKERARPARPPAPHRGLHSSALYADASDERRPADDREHPRGGGSRRSRRQLRGGDRDLGRTEPRSGRRRGRQHPRRASRQRDRPVARPAPPARGPGRAPSIRLSKGVHVVVDGAEDWGAAVTIPQSNARVSFAIPWEGMLLLGTTDTLHEGSPGRSRVTDEDVRTILGRGERGDRGLLARRASVVLRPARPPGGHGATAHARRETVYTRGPTGMLSVAGGKLTTYRRIALDALEQLGVRNLDRRPRPLPGAIGLWRMSPGRSSSIPDTAPPAASLRLARGRGRRPGRRRPVAPRAARRRPPRPARAGPLRRTHEWASHDEDVLRRRTTGWLGGCPRRSF